MMQILSDLINIVLHITKILSRNGKAAKIYMVTQAVYVSGYLCMSLVISVILSYYICPVHGNWSRPDLSSWYSSGYLDLLLSNLDPLQDYLMICSSLRVSVSVIVILDLLPGFLDPNPEMFCIRYWSVIGDGFRSMWPPGSAQPG